MQKNVMKLSEYEKFVMSSENVSFMQSECWQRVKKEWGSEKIIVRDEFGNINGAMQILIKKIPFLNTCFMYAPRGPVCDIRDTYTLRQLIERAKLLADKYNAFVLKLDPMIPYDDYESVNILTGMGFRHNPDMPEDNSVQSLQNYILDIGNRTGEEVFGSFHSKWRYNIRLAKRRGVECDYHNSSLDAFYELMSETGKRDGFCIRSKEYFKNMLDAFGDNARLYMCYTPQGEEISGALAIRFGDRVSYVYGCSTSRHRELMPNYLMQWNMISWAIESGCRIYDFMGIPHCNEENHPNYGVYRFKKGFNGRVVKYAGEFDYIFSRMKHFEISFMLNLLGYKKM